MAHIFVLPTPGGAGLWRLGRVRVVRKGGDT